MKSRVPSGRQSATVQTGADSRQSSARDAPGIQTKSDSAIGKTSTRRPSTTTAPVRSAAKKAVDATSAATSTSSKVSATKSVPGKAKTAPRAGATRGNSAILRNTSNLDPKGARAAGADCNPKKGHSHVRFEVAAEATHVTTARGARLADKCNKAKERLEARQDVAARSIQRWYRRLRSQRVQPESPAGIGRAHRDEEHDESAASSPDLSCLSLRHKQPAKEKGSTFMVSELDDEEEALLAAAMHGGGGYSPPVAARKCSSSGLRGSIRDSILSHGLGRSLQRSVTQSSIRESIRGSGSGGESDPRLSGTLDLDEFEEFTREVAARIIQHYYKEHRTRAALATETAPGCGSPVRAPQGTTYRDAGAWELVPSPESEWSPPESAGRRQAAGGAGYADALADGIAATHPVEDVQQELFDMPRRGSTTRLCGTRPTDMAPRCDGEAQDNLSIDNGLGVSIEGRHSVLKMLDEMEAEHRGFEDDDEAESPVRQTKGTRIMSAKEARHKESKESNQNDSPPSPRRHSPKPVPWELPAKGSPASPPAARRALQYAQSPAISPDPDSSSQGTPLVPARRAEDLASSPEDVRPQAEDLASSLADDRPQAQDLASSLADDRPQAEARPGGAPARPSPASSGAAPSPKPGWGRWGRSEEVPAEEEEAPATGAGQRGACGGTSQTSSTREPCGWQRPPSKVPARESAQNTEDEVARSLSRQPPPPHPAPGIPQPASRSRYTCAGAVETEAEIEAEAAASRKPIAVQIPRLSLTQSQDPGSEKMTNILQFLDEVESAHEEGVSARTAESSLPSTRTESTLTSRAAPCASPWQTQTAGLVSNDPTPRTAGVALVSLTRGAEPVGGAQSQQLATSVYDGVKAKMKDLRGQVAHRDETIRQLQEQVEEGLEREAAQQRAAAAAVEAAVEEQRQEGEATVARHLAFIDRLLADKDALTAKCAELAAQISSSEDQFEDRKLQLQKQWANELKKQKDAWEAAESSKREAWMSDKTREVKELTIRGLEPEIQRLVAKHKAETRRLEEKHADILKRQYDEQSQQQEQYSRQLRDRLLKEREDMVEKERLAGMARLREQAERYEAQAQAQRMRLGTENEVVLERAQAQLREEKARADEVSVRLKRQLDAREEEVRQEAQKEREELKRRHGSELNALKEKFEVQQETWRMHVQDQARKELEERETTLRTKLEKERDEQVEHIMERAEQEAASSRESARKEQELELRQLQARCEAAEAQRHQVEERLSDKHQRTSEAHKEARRRLESTEKQLAATEKELAAKSESIAWLERNLEAAKSDTAAHDRDLRSMFAEKDVLHQQKLQALEDAQALLQQRADAANQEMQSLRARKDKEMEQLEARVRQTISRKDETITQQRDQLSTVMQQLRHTEQVLQRQQEDILRTSQ
ncbi:hypothetical protein CYMTET_16011 [Cymbomonas tetramitiformis]|uniref:Centrosomal protein of 131 kDa n=1 Tax=Cymbomonas tetramitiformis TaxID=36881 RepID=A0AAE0L8L0_9CHLO|nr:hypothetical protein CYMTET_16011 [Cymbomonas tetramitiformis]